jgi:hypothetical protein
MERTAHILDLIDEKRPAIEKSVARVESVCAILEADAEKR